MIDANSLDLRYNHHGRFVPDLFSPSCPDGSLHSSHSHFFLVCHDHMELAFGAIVIYFRLL